MLVLAGSRRMPGAALLALKAAVGSGSGLVTWGAPRSLARIRRDFPLEAMLLGLPETKEGTLSTRAYRPILDFIRKRKIRCVAIGPGLSRNRSTEALVRRLVGRLSVPVVLDADGLNSFQGSARLLKGHRSELILTPNSGEFERLFSKRLPDRRAQRAWLAKRISKFYDVVLLLKGHRTLVAKKNRVYVNRTGNPGLAKGGTGDVLTGIIAAFVAQGLDGFQAAAWASYFHGRAADLAAGRKGELGLTASDVINYLPRAFKSRKGILLE